MKSPTLSAVSLDDVNMLRRLRKHIANCKCCKEALQKEDGSKANQPETTPDVTVSQNGDRGYNGK
jgi:hypothetical protein